MDSDFSYITYCDLLKNSTESNILNQQKIIFRKFYGTISNVKDCMPISKSTTKIMPSSYLSVPLEQDSRAPQKLQ